MESAQEFIKRKNKQFAEEKNIKTKDITRKGFNYWKREAWTFMPQSNYSSKVFVIERIRNIKSDLKSRKRIGNVEYRFGYYVIGKIGNAKDRWVWGQFCPLIPKQDLNKLLDKAKREGTIISD